MSSPLTREEVAKVAKWADSGAPRGNPADMPPAKNWGDNSTWRIGTPDLIVKTEEITVKANAPDWWGEIAPVQIPLDELKYWSVDLKEPYATAEAVLKRHYPDAFQPKG